jgi:hypothetical protein
MYDGCTMYDVGCTMQLLYVGPTLWIKGVLS